MSKSGFVIKNLDPTISEVSITDRNKRQVDIITELRNFKHIDSISLMQVVYRIVCQRRMERVSTPVLFCAPVSTRVFAAYSDDP